MAESRVAAVAGRSLMILLVLSCVLVIAWLAYRDVWPRGEALGNALQPVIDTPQPDQAMVARAIWDNYQETRSNASRWSGVYWGFTFAAAVLSALAGLILKFESILPNQAVKKDVAAVFSMAAALLITLSSSGDFQRKWQANRVAAAELERLGYTFLQQPANNPREYMTEIGQIVHRRHLAIVGGQ